MVRLSGQSGQAALAHEDAPIREIPTPLSAVSYRKTLTIERGESWGKHPATSEIAANAKAHTTIVDACSNVASTMTRRNALFTSPVSAASELRYLRHSSQA
jgi:hypothetical protein